MSLAIKDGNGTAASISTYADASSNLIAIGSLDSSKATYTAAVGNITPVATPTAFFVIQGSATKTIRIKSVKVSGGATAAGSMLLKAERWSDAGTLGSAVLTAVTAGKHDTGSAAATAVVSTVGTANYTTEGTSAGLIAAGRLNLVAIGSAGTSSDCVPYTLEWSHTSTQSLVLRGSGQYLVVGGAGSSLPSGAKLDLMVTWEEDGS